MGNFHGKSSIFYANCIHSIALTLPDPENARIMGLGKCFLLYGENMGVNHLFFAEFLPPLGLVTCSCFYMPNIRRRVLLKEIEAIVWPPPPSVFPDRPLLQEIMMYNFLNHVHTQRIFFCFISGKKVDRRYNSMRSIEFQF